MAWLVPIRALALGAPGRECGLTGRPLVTAPQAGVDLDLNGLHRVTSMATSHSHPIASR